jgi:predicted nucleic acid-binding Zn ribbon protein
MRHRSPGPRRIGAAVARVRAQAMPRNLLAAVQEAWPGVAGARIAAEAEPIAEREGTITIACRAATWAEELDLLHDDLLERLNGALAVGDRAEPGTGDEPVRALRFTATGTP